MCVLARSEIHLFSHPLSFVCVLLALRVCAACLLRSCCVCACCGGWVVWSVCARARAVCAKPRARRAPVACACCARPSRAPERRAPTHAFITREEVQGDQGGAPLRGALLFL